MIEVYYDDGSWRFRFISNEGREIYSPPLRFDTDFEANAYAKQARAMFQRRAKVVDQSSCAFAWVASLAAIAST